ncbi:hypothetical protein GCK32_001309 [Trichostrongylus colubriformis]|uniref:Uncharacterized protein n=1 Tax=Trichostrongylus colubriformis TaxID=6319 RepID=A0AAN8FKI2_TRICO
MTTAALPLLLLLLCSQEATSKCPYIYESPWEVTLQDGLCFSVERNNSGQCSLFDLVSYTNRSQATCLDYSSKMKSLWKCFCPYGGVSSCLKALNGKNPDCGNWNYVENRLQDYLTHATFNETAIPLKKSETSTSTIKTRTTPETTQLITAVTRARSTNTTLETKTKTTTTIASTPTITTSTTTATAPTTKTITTTTTTTPTTTTTTTPTTVPPVIITTSTTRTPSTTTTITTTTTTPTTPPIITTTSTTPTPSITTTTTAVSTPTTTTTTMPTTIPPVITTTSTTPTPSTTTTTTTTAPSTATIISTKASLPLLGTTTTSEYAPVTDYLSLTEAAGTPSVPLINVAVSEMSFDGIAETATLPPEPFATVYIIRKKEYKRRLEELRNRLIRRISLPSNAESRAIPFVGSTSSCITSCRWIRHSQYGLSIHNN